MKKYLLIILAALSAIVSKAQVASSPNPLDILPFDYFETQLNFDESAYITWYEHVDPAFDMIRTFDSANGGAPLNVYLDKYFYVNHSTGTIHLDPTQISYTDLKNTPTARSFNNAASRALITTAAAANGFQLSGTRDSSVSYTTTISVTASIAGAGTGYVVLEICPTNSAGAANWVEISRFGNSQSFSLALTLAGVQALDGHVGGMVPAGYYARLRQVSVTGTVTFGSNGLGQEVLL